MRPLILTSFFLSLAAAFDAVDDAQRYLGLQTAEPPAPTTAPEDWLVRWKLAPRQSAGSGTCGWINANSANAVTCSPNYVCAHNTINFVFGCCSGDLNTCTLPTACFDSTLARVISATANGFTQICASAAAPFCSTYIAGSGYAFGCGSQSGQTFLVYDSITGSAGGTAVVAGGVTTGFEPTGSGASAVINGGFTASGSGSAATQTAAAQGGSSSGGTGSSSTSGSSSGGSGLSTGAIVAIAVCVGVVVIALIALIAFLVYRRGKKQKQAAVAAQQGSVPPPPGPPGPHQTYDGSTQLGSASQMTEANMNKFHPAQAGEWDFAKNAVRQPGVPITHENDGIKVTDILPEDAVDERAQQELRSQIGSNVAPTAVAPTMVSHHVQGV